MWNVCNLKAFSIHRPLKCWLGSPLPICRCFVDKIPFGKRLSAAFFSRFCKEKEDPCTLRQIVLNLNLTLSQRTLQKFWEPCEFCACVHYWEGITFASCNARQYKAIGRSVTGPYSYWRHFYCYRGDDVNKLMMLSVEWIGGSGGCH